MFVGETDIAGTIPVDKDYLSLRGPVEREGAGLVLRIPLGVGGEQLRLVCVAISEIDGNDLVISIPDWLAEKIEIGDGTEVYVDDRGGKLNITKAPHPVAGWVVRGRELSRIGSFRVEAPPKPDR